MYPHANRGGIDEFEFLDLYGRRVRCEDNTSLNYTGRLEKSRNISISRKFMIRAVGKIGRLIKKPELAWHLIWFMNPNNKDRLLAYYYEKIKGSDLIVFAGGGIIECSSNHDYFHHIDLITRIAEELDIPVVFNAVGRVIDENHMFGWNIMKTALNRSCVKSISCRDGSDWINENIFNNREFAREVPCCAVCAAKVFGVFKKNSNVIGIGIIRGNIFASYGKNFSEENLLSLYSDIICKLIKRGYEVKLFTNGYSGDIAFGNKLLDSLEKIYVKIEFLEPAQNAEMLVEQISRFKGIITARLHSCIVAYSLDIPMVAISWTNKVRNFMTLVGEPHLAVDMGDLNSEYMVDLFEKKMCTPYSEEIRSRLDDTVYKEMKYIKSFAKS